MTALTVARVCPCGRTDHHAHGLCQTCYDRLWRTGRYQRVTRSREDVLTEWELIADDVGRRVVRAAPRMGMTPAALCRALDRAGVRHVHLRPSQRLRSVPDPQPNG